MIISYFSSGANFITVDRFALIMLGMSWAKLSQNCGYNLVNIVLLCFIFQWFKISKPMPLDISEPLTYLFDY